MQAGPGLPDEASNANQPKGQVPGGAGGDLAAGISGGVPFNHLWPVVAGGGGMTKDEALDLALEALSPWMDTDADHTEQHAAYYAIKQALDKKAENARELGLDYEPVGLIDRLINPEQHYEFTDPKKANAVLMSLCQEAADALAAPVQEPVAWLRDPKHYPAEDKIMPHVTWEKERLNTTPLYTTPPAQSTVPDAMTSADIQEHIEYVAGWNDCRQAMLEMMK
jgi:hypothetical protein